MEDERYDGCVNVGFNSRGDGSEAMYISDLWATAFN